MRNRLRRDERGAVMVLAAVAFTALLLIAGLALDFGRAHLLRAQLQTAVDAAALAGALQVQPMVELTRSRSVAVESTCTDPVTGQTYTCMEWQSASPARVSGTEWDLLIQGGWRAATLAQCSWPYRCSSSYRIVREWLVLPAATVPVAKNAFYLNATWPQTQYGARVDSLTVTTDPVKAEVTATATMSTPTTFLKLVGIRELRFERSGSAVPVRR